MTNLEIADPARSASAEKLQKAFTERLASLSVRAWDVTQEDIDAIWQESPAFVISQGNVRGVFYEESVAFVLGSASLGLGIKIGLGRPIEPGKSDDENLLDLRLRDGKAAFRISPVDDADSDTNN